MQRLSVLILIFTFITSVLLSNSTNSTSVYANADYDLVVSSEVLHLRDGPGLSYSIVTTLKENDSLQLIKREGDWYHVQFGDVDGWVASWLTSSITSNEHASNRTAISQVDRLNVRSEPSLSSAVLTQIHSGQEVKVIEIKSDWIKIVHNETIGWVSPNYMTINESESTQDSSETKKSSEQSTDEVTSFDKNIFTITVDEVILRKKPNLTSRPLGSVKRGEQYEVLERQNNWVKINYQNKDGWLYNFYGSFNTSNRSFINNQQEAMDPSIPTEDFVKVIYNGTNLREKPTTDANVVFIANAGETYKIVSTANDWYEIEINNQITGFVANWVVSTSKESPRKIKTPKKEPRKKGTLKGLTIVVDPGHGGNDHGTIGVRGTDEKDVNLKTAELLISKLKSAGANVISTRVSDTYVDLRKRVSVSHQYAADAFISIHHDATEDSSISGFTTYYTKSFQKSLADAVHEGLAQKVDLRNRGVQSSNLLVLRENKQNAILIELGFLSNPSDERIITTDYYREQATLGIYEGILNYFDEQL